jgi:hypothetical protein
MEQDANAFRPDAEHARDLSMVVLLDVGEPKERAFAGGDGSQRARDVFPRVVARVGAGGSPGGDVR